ncbi:MAG TPA: SAM-dependent chlorinase/fluorinase [Candidatus Thermoplasmatota archaeon]|nr:SAM-dependent chlorinase/fluorinase [Candidatus Thermoplasmatota archaeon]
MITLTSDFGDSAYAGAVRGVLLARAPRARLVDVTHAIPAGDVTAGALALLAALPHFPRANGAEPVVHLAVVDPGVGTARRGVAVQCRGTFLVGPDNGLLTPVANALGLGSVREISEPRLWN